VSGFDERLRDVRSSEGCVPGDLLDALERNRRTERGQFLDHLLRAPVPPFAELDQHCFKIRRVPINKITENMHFGLRHVAREFHARDNLQRSAARRVYRRVNAIHRVMIGQREHNQAAFTRIAHQIRRGQLAI